MSFTNTQVGLIAVIPSLLGLIAMIWWARHSDRTGERIMHIAVPLIICSVGLIGCGLSSNPIISIIMITFTFMGAYSIFRPFWSIPSKFLTESSAAVGFALINCVGALGGFIGPVLLGIIDKEIGLFVLSAAFLTGLIPLFVLKRKCLNIQSLLITIIQQKCTNYTFLETKSAAIK